jgi:multidrug transporter EmrE-like cation transporter
MAWAYVALTVALTVYGQIVIKWQMAKAGPLPAEGGPRVLFLLRQLANPWIASGLAAALVAALAWMAAMTKLELSAAYPFMSLSFVLVLVLSALLLHEPLSVWRVTGVAIIVLGVIVAGRGL